MRLRSSITSAALAGLLISTAAAIPAVAADGDSRAATGTMPTPTVKPKTTAAADRGSEADMPDVPLPTVKPNPMANPFQDVTAATGTAKPDTSAGAAGAGTTGSTTAQSSTETPTGEGDDTVDEPDITVLPECAPEVEDKPPECDATLSEQLSETGGVIQPPPTPDNDIHVPAPDPNPGTTPVIPPSALPDQQQPAED